MSKVKCDLNTLISSNNKSILCNISGKDEFDIQCNKGFTYEDHDIYTNTNNDNIFTKVNIKKKEAYICHQPDDKCQTDYYYYLRNYDSCKHKLSLNNVSTKIIIIDALSFSAGDYYIPMPTILFYNKLIFKYGFRKENIFLVMNLKRISDCYNYIKQKLESYNITFNIGKYNNNYNKCTNYKQYVDEGDRYSDLLKSKNNFKELSDVNETTFALNVFFQHMFNESENNLFGANIMSDMNGIYKTLFDNNKINYNDNIIVSYQTHGGNDYVEGISGQNVYYEIIFNNLINPIRNVKTIIFDAYFCHNDSIMKHFDTYAKNNNIQNCIFLSSYPSNNTGFNKLIIDSFGGHYDQSTLIPNVPMIIYQNDIDLNNINDNNFNINHVKIISHGWKGGVANNYSISDLAIDHNSAGNTIKSMIKYLLLKIVPDAQEILTLTIDNFEYNNLYEFQKIFDNIFNHSLNVCLTHDVQINPLINIFEMGTNTISDVQNTLYDNYMTETFKTKKIIDAIKKKYPFSKQFIYHGKTITDLSCIQQKYKVDIVDLKKDKTKMKEIQDFFNDNKNLGSGHIVSDEIYIKLSNNGDTIGYMGIGVDHEILDPMVAIKYKSQNLYELLINECVKYIKTTSEFTNKIFYIFTNDYADMMVRNGFSYVGEKSETFTGENKINYSLGTEHLHTFVFKNPGLSGGNLSIDYYKKYKKYKNKYLKKKSQIKHNL